MYTNASSIVISLGSLSSGIVALIVLYLIYGPNWPFITLTGFLSSGCSPRFLISFEDLLPGLASAINVIALFNPIEKISSGDSRVADLFAHLT